MDGPREYGASLPITPHPGVGPAIGDHRLLPRLPVADEGVALVHSSGSWRRGTDKLVNWHRYSPLFPVILTGAIARAANHRADGETKVLAD